MKNTEHPDNELLPDDEKIVLKPGGLNSVLFPKEEELKEKEQFGFTRTDALENAEMLLSFASENGIDLQTDIIRFIVEAKKMEQNGEWTVDGETNFWIAYKSVAQVIKPVSIDSIRASEEAKIKTPNLYQKLFRRKHKFSIVHKAVLRYSVLALIFMITLLVLQIFAIIGSQLLTSIETSSALMKNEEERLTELILITENNTDNRSAILEKTNLEISIEKNTKEMNSSIELLLTWMRMADFLYTDETKKMEEDIQPAMLEADADMNFDALSQQFTIDKNIMAIQEAKSLIQILTLYILPLLYGLLGGFVFVLRSITFETRSFTYTKASNLKYGLRIHLGALAGLAIGLFWGDIERQNINFIESMGTALVAFLAGYSIEFVFRLVDQLIFSIGEKKEDKKNETANSQK